MQTRWRRAGAAAAAALALAAQGAPAQTDYYNTDAGRPVQVEDALPVERYAFELQLAPLRLERASGGAYAWEVAPEIAYGILPRTQLEVGFPLAALDGGDDEGRREGLAGIEIAALHALNVETRTLPALAVAGELLLPAGGLGPDRAYASLKGIATRSFPGPARVHLNGRYTFGPGPDESPEPVPALAVADDVVVAPAPETESEVSRWMAGVAVDRALPLRSLLVTADLFAEGPLADDEDPAWTAEAGVRYQTSPQLALDLGVGRRFAGPDQGWFFTFGAARAFAVRSLMPLRQERGR